MINSFLSKPLRIFVAGIFLILINISAKAEPFVIDSLQFRYNLNTSVLLLPDDNGSYTVQQVIADEFSLLFRKDRALVRKAKVHWVKLSIINKLNNHIHWHLWFTPMQYNEVYQVTGKDYTLLAKNGNYVKNSESCFPQHPKVFPITLPANKEIILLIRVDTSVPQEFKPYISTELRLEEPEMQRYMNSWIILAVLVSILVSLGFYVLLQFFLFRDKSFLYFFLGFCGMAAYFIVFDRVSYALFHTDHITRFTGNYIALLCFYFYISFTRYFLDPNNNFPWWQRLLKRVQYFYAIPLILVILINFKVFWNFTPYIHSIHIISFFLLLIFAFKTYRKGGEQAGHYLLANSVFFFFLCLFIYFVQTKPSEGYSSILLESSLKIGSLGQVLLFTLAMANRFSRLSRQVVEKQLENEKLEKEKILEIQKIITDTNLELEDKVKKRTQEISLQKEELETQAEHLEKANLEITNQKKLIEKAHSQITDSIFYAAIIQQAVLPKPSLMKLCFKDFFTLYMPRDIVSGDFYWTTQVENITLFGVADCTGHGVPGAFMSMLGISLLNEIVKRESITKPEQILNLLRIHLISALQQESAGSDVRDGMDISLCALYKNYEDVENNSFILEFAGAHNPMLLVTNSSNKVNFSPDENDGELLEVEGTKAIYQVRADLMPISMHFKLEPFSRKTIRVYKNDMIYLHTDGIVDQIGGPDYKKISGNRLRKLLLRISHESAEIQHHSIEQEIIEWMNFPDQITGSPCDQIDDICILGVRI